jgi:nitroreductase/NAD-dependent dihydropyrimidine dehydrogenase PreA subunit
VAIPTTRTKERANILIEADRCTGCGNCVKVCKDFGLEIVGNKVAISRSSIFGCVGCGHCMAICKTEAIKISGREISFDDLFDLPSPLEVATYDQLSALLKNRRSIREFKDKPIEREKIDKIVDAAKRSPMGLPPTDVNLLILEGKEINRQFAMDFCSYLGQMRWLISKWFLALMRPFWGKENDEMFRGFVKPVFDIFIGKAQKGNNIVNYDPPLSIYFYGSPYSDPADPIIAATTAMYAAESLGLGTCMIGSIHPMIQSGKQAKKFREQYKIRYRSREGIFVIFGYADVKYNKGINRTFASITTIDQDNNK